MNCPPALVTRAGCKLALERILQASRTHADPQQAAELGRVAAWLQALLASDLLDRKDEAA